MNTIDLNADSLQRTVTANRAGASAALHQVIGSLRQLDMDRQVRACFDNEKAGAAR